MDKEDVYIYIHIYTHIMEYYSAIFKKEFYHLLQEWLLSEISHTEKHKYCVISLICEI